jgi:hypothetical protein
MTFTCINCGIELKKFCVYNQRIYCRKHYDEKVESHEEFRMKQIYDDVKESWYKIMSMPDKEFDRLI